MPSSHPGWSPPPDFHPEFGRLCPSARQRRGMRLAVVSIVATLAIGASMGVAALPKEPIAGVRDLSASSVQRSVSATDVVSPVTRAQESCETGVIQALAAIFLDSTCGPAKVHARHGGHVPNRVATVIIGRTDASAAPLTSPATAAAVAIEPSQAAASGVEKSTASMTPPLEQRASRPKKAKTNSGAPNPYASIPRSGRDSYEAYDRSRYVAPQSGFDGRFGRTW
jgi:hypothetical protein